MNKKDSLGDRMKAYESVSRNFLIRRTPVIIRIDGKAFHTFTKGFEKPFDAVLMQTMQETMRALCENIQGCVFGYTQSDEITLVLTDYATIDTDAWFDYNVQKLTSIAASMATLYFNRFFDKNVAVYHITDDIQKYRKALAKGALFDARAFNVPKEEVINCLIWRQQDATRNSIQSVAQSLFSPKELKGISCKDLQNKMLTEKDVNWNNFSTAEKRGTACVKKIVVVQNNEDIVERAKWCIDYEIPIFTENREYIDKWVI